LNIPSSFLNILHLLSEHATFFNPTMSEYTALPVCTTETSCFNNTHFLSERLTIWPNGIAFFLLWIPYLYNSFGHKYYLECYNISLLSNIFQIFLPNVSYLPCPLSNARIFFLNVCRNSSCLSELIVIAHAALLCLNFPKCKISNFTSVWTCHVR
jgi:hypothetical protein